MPDGFRVTLTGVGNNQPESYPTLHGHQIKPPQPQHPHNPPPGLFQWHYLQCVIKKFAHTNYTELQNIAYYELPLQVEDNDDCDVWWPSAALDHGRAQQMEDKKSEEHKRDIVKWANAV